MSSKLKYSQSVRKLLENSEKVIFFLTKSPPPPPTKEKCKKGREIFHKLFLKLPSSKSLKRLFVQTKVYEAETSKVEQISRNVEYDVRRLADHQ